MHVVHRCRFTGWKPAAVQALGFNRSGSRLAVARSNGDIEVWSLRHNWFCERKIPGSRDIHVTGVFWIPSLLGGTDRLISVGLNGRIVEWDLYTLLPRFVSDSFGGSIWAGSVSPSGTHLVVGCEDGTLRLFDVSDPNESPVYIRAFTKHKGRVLSVDWSPDGSLIASGGSDGLVRTWHSYTGRNVLHLAVDSVRLQQGVRVSSDPGHDKYGGRSDDDGLGFGSDDGEDDESGGDRDGDEDDDDGEAGDVLGLPKIGATGAGFGSNRRRRRPNRLTRVSRALVWSVRFIDTQTLASGDSLGHVQIWDVRFGTLVHTIAAHQADILTLSVVPGNILGSDFATPMIFASGVDSKVIQIGSMLVTPANLEVATASGFGAPVGINQIEEGKSMNERMGHELSWAVLASHRIHTHDVLALASSPRLATTSSSSTGAQSNNAKATPSKPNDTNRPSKKARRTESHSSSTSPVYEVLLVSGGVDSQLVLYSTRRFGSTRPSKLSAMPHKPVFSCSASALAPYIPHPPKDSTSSVSSSSSSSSSSDSSTQSTSQSFYYTPLSSLDSVVRASSAPPALSRAVLTPIPTQSRLIMLSEKKVRVFALGVHPSLPDPPAVDVTQLYSSIAPASNESLLVTSTPTSKGKTPKSSSKVNAVRNANISDSSDSDDDDNAKVLSAPLVTTTPGKSSMTPKSAFTPAQSLTHPNTPKSSLLLTTTSSTSSSTDLVPRLLPIPPREHPNLHDGQHLRPRESFYRLAELSIDSTLNLTNAILSPNGTMIAVTDPLAVRLFSLVAADPSKPSKDVVISRVPFPINPSQSSPTYPTLTPAIQMALHKLSSSGATQLAFSPDSTVLAVAEPDGAVYLFDLACYRVYAKLKPTGCKNLLAGEEKTIDRKKLIENETTTKRRTMAIKRPRSKMEKGNQLNVSDSESESGKDSDTDTERTRNESLSSSSSSHGSKNVEDEEDDTTTPAIRLMRFSTCGQYLVTYDDNGLITLYHLPLPRTSTGGSSSSKPSLICTLPPLDEPASAIALLPPLPTLSTNSTKGVGVSSSSSSSPLNPNYPAIVVGLASSRFFVYDTNRQCFATRSSDGKSSGSGSAVSSALIRLIPPTQAGEDGASGHVQDKIVHIGVSCGTRIVSLSGGTVGTNGSKLGKLPPQECYAMVLTTGNYLFHVDFPLALLRSPSDLTFHGISSSPQPLQPTTPKSTLSTSSSSTTTTATTPFAKGSSSGNSVGNVFTTPSRNGKGSNHVTPASRTGGMPLTSTTGAVTAALEALKQAQSIQPRIRALTKFRNILYADYLVTPNAMRSSLAVVEANWLEIVASLPPPLRRKKYGSRHFV